MNDRLWEMFEKLFLVVEIISMGARLILALFIIFLILLLWFLFLTGAL